MLQIQRRGQMAPAAKIPEIREVIVGSYRAICESASRTRILVLEQSSERGCGRMSGSVRSVACSAGA